MRLPAADTGARNGESPHRRPMRRCSRGCARRLPTRRLSRRAGARPARVAARARRQQAARASIERLLLQAIGARATRLARTVGADEVLARLAQLLEAIAGRSTYIALLAQYPQAFARVLRLLAASRWATDYLVQHPILLDELLDEPLTGLTNASPVEGSGYAAELAPPMLGDDVERR
jgi:glutamine synthetase adenylyltransferase